MLVVGLNDLAGVGIELNDLLIAIAGEESTGAHRMPDTAEWSLLRTEGVDDAAGLRVPEMRDAIEPRREEAAAVSLECDISHCSGVSLICMKAPLAFDVPDAAAAVVTSTEQESAGLREESDSLDAFRMAGECVQESFGNVGLLSVFVTVEVSFHIDLPFLGIVEQLR